MTRVDSKYSAFLRDVTCFTMVYGKYRYNLYEQTFSMLLTSYKQPHANIKLNMLYFIISVSEIT